MSKICIRQWQNRLCLALSFVLLLVLAFTTVTLGETNKNNQETNLIVDVLALEDGGDCTIIQFQDIQILIDAGVNTDNNQQLIQSAMGSAIGENDHLWDYIIFTHPDDDHIGGARRVFNYLTYNNINIGKIIDYDFESDTGPFLTATANTYRKTRKELCESNKIEYFSAAVLNENNRLKKYPLGTECTLSILYNYFDCLDNYKPGQTNNISVCILIEYKKQKVLFTGDLEKEGEEKLLLFHSDLIQNVTLYKAAHHGSRTSNTEKFVDVIRPCYVTCTHFQNSFITEDSINSFLRYTDYIYPTYVKNKNDGSNYFKLFGTTRFVFDGEKAAAVPENNSEAKSIREARILENENSLCWFESLLSYPESNLKDELRVYTFDEEIASYNNCTLVKYGHYDILIDCGSINSSSMAYVDKLKQYVVDGVIECVIVTHFHLSNISQLIGNYKNGEPICDGVFANFAINTVIDSGATGLSATDPSGFYSRYCQQIKDLPQHIKIMPGSIRNLLLTNELSLCILGCKSKVDSDADENNYSLSIIVTFGGKKMVFVGDTEDYEYLSTKHASRIENASFLRLSNSLVSLSRQNSFMEFLSIVKPQSIVIGTPINYTLSNGKVFMGEQDQRYLRDLQISKGYGEIFYCGYIQEKKYHPINGDLIFSLTRFRKIVLSPKVIRIDGSKATPL